MFVVVVVVVVDVAVVIVVVVVAFVAFVAVAVVASAPGTVRGFMHGEIDVVLTIAVCVSCVSSCRCCRFHRCCHCCRSNLRSSAVVSCSTTTAASIAARRINHNRDNIAATAVT